MNQSELYIDSLSGKDFEKYIAYLFKSFGYIVGLTKSTGDYGADLIISNDKVTMAIQVKRCSTAIGVSAIQEVVASKAYYNVSSCTVVTNNFFTPNAITLAKANNVYLVDRTLLLKMISSSVKYNNSVNPVCEIGPILFNEALKVVSEHNMASAELLREKLNVDYNIAAKIISELERKNIISRNDGTLLIKIVY